jgi:hypothetical protein
LQIIRRIDVDQMALASNARSSASTINGVSNGDHGQNFQWRSPVAENLQVRATLLLHSERTRTPLSLLAMPAEGQQQQQQQQQKQQQCHQSSVISPRSRSSGVPQQLDSKQQQELTSSNTSSNANGRKLQQQRSS